MIAVVGESNSKYKTIRNAKEFREDLAAHPSQVIVIEKKWDWIDDAVLLDQMHSLPSFWIVGVEGFEDESLLKFNNSGRVRGFFGPREPIEPLIKAAMKQLKAENSRRARDSAGHLERANDRLKALTRAMIGIQRANSVGEIEIVLNEALNLALKLAWVKIVFEHQSSMESDRSAAVAQFDFRLGGGPAAGRILFGRKPPGRFTESEKKFLQEITDTAALALQRLGQIDEAETLKQQWEATFDAILHPLCLTNAKGLIVRTNRAFSRVTGKAFLDLIGQEALSAFSTETPAIGPAGLPRISRGDGVHKKEYDVISQSIGNDLIGGASRLILFLDITEQLRLERKILESSKLAELGTIASSIAHELNNPLGGMLSFLQLIKMDLEPNDPILPDITAMEEATLRCRDIIQNLLGFARLRQPQSLEECNLREPIERAVKLIALQSKSNGIDVRLQIPPDDLHVMAQINSLTQAFCNVLQNSIDAILERRKLEPGFQGKIEIEVSKFEKKFRVTVADNGVGIRPEHETQVFTPLFSTKASEKNSGLGLTVAYSIIRDHSGELEITSRPGSGTTAVISLTIFTPSVES